MKNQEIIKKSISFSDRIEDLLKDLKRNYPDYRQEDLEDIISYSLEKALGRECEGSEFNVLIQIDTMCDNDCSKECKFKN